MADLINSEIQGKCIQCLEENLGEIDINPGQIIYCTDTGNQYLDTLDSVRVQVTDSELKEGIEANLASINNISGNLSILSNVAITENDITDAGSPTTIKYTSKSIPTERKIYYGLPKFNGNHTYTSSTNYFAPTTVGKAGQILISNGSGAPVWTDAGNVEVGGSSSTLDNTLSIYYETGGLTGTDASAGGYIIYDGSESITFDSTKITVYGAKYATTAYTANATKGTLTIDYYTNTGSGTSHVESTYNGSANYTLDLTNIFASYSGIANIANSVISKLNITIGESTYSYNGSSTVSIDIDSAISTAISNAAVSDMVGATDSEDGESGLVPAPSAGDNAKYLTGAGTYENATLTNPLIIQYQEGGLTGEGVAVLAAVYDGSERLTFSTTAITVNGAMYAKTAYSIKNALTVNVTTGSTTTTTTYDGSEAKTIDINMDTAGAADVAAKVAYNLNLTAGSTSYSYNGSETVTIDIDSIIDDAVSSISASSINQTLTAKYLTGTSGGTTNTKTYNGSAATTIDLTSSTFYAPYSGTANESKRFNGLLTINATDISGDNTESFEFDGSQYLNLNIIAPDFEKIEEDNITTFNIITPATQTFMIQIADKLYYRYKTDYTTVTESESTVIDYGNTVNIKDIAKKVLDIGGRNYLYNTKSLASEAGKISFTSEAWTLTTDENGYGVRTATGTGSWINFTLYTGIDASNNSWDDKTLTFSVDINCDDIVEKPSTYTIGMAVFASNDKSTWKRYMYKTYNLASSAIDVNTDDFVDNEWFRLVNVFTPNSSNMTVESTTEYAYYVYVFQIYLSNTNTSGTLSFRKPKLELGYINTDWTPNPDDDISASVADELANSLSINYNTYTVKYNTTTANSISYNGSEASTIDLSSTFIAPYANMLSHCIYFTDYQCNNIDWDWCADQNVGIVFPNGTVMNEDLENDYGYGWIDLTNITAGNVANALTVNYNDTEIVNYNGSEAVSTDIYPIGRNYVYASGAYGLYGSYGVDINYYYSEWQYSIISGENGNAYLNINHGALYMNGTSSSADEEMTVEYITQLDLSYMKDNEYYTLTVIPYADRYLQQIDGTFTIFIRTGSASASSGTDTDICSFGNGEFTYTFSVSELGIADSTYNYLGFRFEVPSSTTYRFYLTSIKLEKGKYATDWCPAASDNAKIAMYAAQYYMQDAITDITVDGSDITYTKYSGDSGSIEIEAANKVNNALIINYAGSEIVNYNGSEVITTDIYPVGRNYVLCSGNYTTNVDLSNITFKSYTSDSTSITVNSSIEAYDGYIRIADIDYISKNNCSAATWTTFTLSDDLDTSLDYTLTIKFMVSMIYEENVISLYGDDGDTEIGSIDYETSDEGIWVTKSIAFAGSSITNKAIIIQYSLSTVSGILDIAWIKLEKGSYATDWCPAPEDNTNYLSLAGGSLTGDLYPSVTDTYSLGTSDYKWTTVYSSTGAWNGSDRKIKDHIEYLEDDINLDKFVMGLKPVMYTLKSGTGKRHHMGLYAQDVSEIANSTIGDIAAYQACVKKDNTNEEDSVNNYNNGYYDENIDDNKLDWCLNYNELLAPVLAFVQKQNKKIEDQEDRIKQLEDLVAKLLNQ